MEKTHLVYDEINQETIFAGTESDCEDYILKNSNFGHSIQIMSDDEKLLYNLYEKENLVCQ
jgi:hypothetical protein